MRFAFAISCIVLASRAAAQTPPAYALGAPAAKITEPFSRIIGAQELSDGRLLLADFKDGILYIADFKTGSRGQIGRSGAGPNEYARIAGVARRLADTLYVFDGGNHRYLRVDGMGRLAGTVAFPSRVREWSSARGVDSRGNFYWTGGVVVRDDQGYKRAQNSKVMRWEVGSDTTAEVGEFADHAPALHENKYFPYAQRDAWVVTPNGRIGVLVARDYHLRWIENGKVVSEGAPIPFQPIPVTARERDGFRAEREAMGPAGGGGSMTGSANSAATARKTMLEYYPDPMFPQALPPFVENGATLSPRGDIWVERSRVTGDRIPRFDVLGADGKVKATVQFPPSAQLIALDRNGIYLIRIDDDGLQFLERHNWPANLR
jgi:hypothetical protein